MARGRPRNESRWIYFNVKQFERDLYEAMKDVMFKLREDLYQRMLRNASRLEFSTFEAVHTEAGRTSDFQRRQAFLNSFTRDSVARMGGQFIMMTIEAMAKDFEDSHIGLYYEYGTGTKESPESPLPYMGDWNPVRGARMPGRPIYTRPVSEGKTWVDAGGNVRIATSKNITNLSKKPGWEIQAQFWFKKAVDEVRDYYLQEIYDAIKHINPLSEKYFIVQPTLNMGNLSYTRKGRRR